MSMIVLLLTIGGQTSTHQPTAFSYNYDARARTLQYTEAGKVQTVPDIAIANMNGWSLSFRTDKIFGARFD
jgi:uncharacterized protein YggE